MPRITTAACREFARLGIGYVLGTRAGAAYVATSMRNRHDFRNMADTCERIFSDPRLKEMNLRYFDPTLSAAGGHEDKGLIECLMVKCASG